MPTGAPAHAGSCAGDAAGSRRPGRTFPRHARPRARPRAVPPRVLRLHAPPARPRPRPPRGRQTPSPRRRAAPVRASAEASARPRSAPHDRRPGTALPPAEPAVPAGPAAVPPGVPRPGNNPAALAGRSVAAIVPAIRGFKIADNQYPRPVDRVWVSFNYYDGVNSGHQQRARRPIKNMQVYNETFGFEKTFLDQQASIGFRLPVNTLTITSGFPGLSGTHTSTGQLQLVLQVPGLRRHPGQRALGRPGHVLSRPVPRRSPATPPSSGSTPFEIQPFLGYILQGRQRRTSRDSTRSPFPPTAGSRPCTTATSAWAISSTDRSDPAGHPLGDRAGLRDPPEHPAQLGGLPAAVHRQDARRGGPDLRPECRPLRTGPCFPLAYVRPVTGPLPFSGEFAMMLNIPFGGQGRPEHPVTPPRHRPVSGPE